MKRFIPIFLLVLLLAPLIRAADKISDLPASTAPSTNTFIEIADMDAVIKSRKYLFTNLVRQSEVTSAALQGKLGNIYQATNGTLTKLSTNTITGIGRIVLESAAGGAGIPGTMINTGTPVTNAVPAALDATGTNYGPTSVIISNGNMSVPKSLLVATNFFFRTNGFSISGPSTVGADLHTGTPFLFDANVVATNADAHNLLGFSGIKLSLTGSNIFGVTPSGLNVYLNSDTDFASSVSYALEGVDNIPPDADTANDLIYFTGKYHFGIGGTLAGKTGVNLSKGQGSAVIGMNVGDYSQAFGGIFTSQLQVDGQLSVGVAADSVVNGGIGATNIGGYFEVASSVNVPPVWESGVVVLDNRDTGVPLLIGRTNNGTKVFQVTDGGQGQFTSVVSTNSVTTGSLTVATNASIAGTNFTSELIVTNGITLGGVRNTAWPAGGAAIVGTLINTNGVTTNGALVTMSGTTGTNTAPAGVFVTNSTSLLIPGDLSVGGSMTISGATNVFTLASGDRWTQGKVNTNGYVYTLWSTFDPARTWVVVYGSSLGPWQFQLQSLPGWSNIYALGHWQNRSLGGSGLGHATNEWLTNPPPQAINGTNVIVFNEFGVNEGLTSDANVAAFKTNLWWFLSQQRASNCVVCLFDIFPRIIADSMGTNFNKMNMWFRRELIKTNFVDVYIPWSKYLIDNGITPDWIDITHPDTGAWQRNAAAVDWCFRMGPYASPDFLQPPLITKFGTNTYRVYDDNDSHVVLEWGKTGSSFTVNGTDIASASLAGTVINSTASSGLLSVDATKTNGIAATAGHITNAWGIFTGETNKFIAGDGALRTPVITASATNIVAGLGITLDGGSAAITGGIKGYIPVPYDCTIQGVTMVATSVGSATIDIWKTNYANFPPTVANTITAAAKPTITSTNKYTDAALSGWVTNVTAGDVIAFNVDSASSITNLTLVLKVLK